MPTRTPTLRTLAAELTTSSLPRLPNFPDRLLKVDPLSPSHLINNNHVISYRMLLSYDI